MTTTLVHQIFYNRLQLRRHKTHETVLALPSLDFWQRVYGESDWTDRDVYRMTQLTVTILPGVIRPPNNSEEKGPHVTRTSNIRTVNPTKQV